MSLRQAAGGRANDPVVVLQDRGRWWRYRDLTGVVTAERAADVPAALSAVEQTVEQEGLYAAGYLAYEAAAAYGLAVHPSSSDAPPLLWFGLFRGREVVDFPASDAAFRFGPWEPGLDRAAYRTALAAIKDAIAAGDTYQANFTFPLQAGFDGDPWALFAHLAGAQRAGYCAYLDLGRHVICCASPELFFRLDGERIESRPMKGTAGRGLTLDEDRAQIDWLRASEKNRAENVMIVDMIRNDLGRVAAVGSVHVPALFTVERYPTLLQMTSTVAARTTAGLADLFAAVFPCASITGAPKHRTMQILRALEAGPRGVYTGAIGSVSPGRRAQFNVAIRTAVVDRAAGRARYHVGSGVVWDSDADAEYDECLLKARILDAADAPREDFRLLESLLWTPAQGYALLERHLRRLGDSAEYFGFDVDLSAVRRELAALAAGLDAPRKARLLVARDGRVTLEARPLEEGARPEPVRLGLAREPVDAGDAFLYHKTTRRAVYDAARAGRPDCDDVILWNERGELTETSASNLVLELDGRRYTPPVHCGLLAGTFRAELLAQGTIEERLLTVDDLRRASAVSLINSVRGWQRAVWQDAAAAPATRAATRNSLLT